MPRPVGGVIHSALVLADDTWAPRIVISNGDIKKTVFLDASSIGLITNLSEEMVADLSGKMVLVLGTKGVLFADQSGSIKKSVKFELPIRNVAYVGWASEDDWIFLQEIGGWTPVCLNNESLVERSDKLCFQRKMNNNCGKFISIQDVDKGGIRIVDDIVKVRWKEKGDNEYQTEFFNLQCNKLHGDNSANCKIVQTYFRDFPFRIDNVIAGNFCEGGMPLCYLTTEDNEIKLYSFEKKLIKKFNAPMVFPRVFDAVSGKSIQLISDTSPYWAFIFTARYIKQQSILYIYSNAGKLIYQEILPTGNRLLSIIPSRDNKNKDLLIADNEKIWRYELIRRP